MSHLPTAVDEDSHGVFVYKDRYILVTQFLGPHISNVALLQHHATEMRTAISTMEQQERLRAELTEQREQQQQQQQKLLVSGYCWLVGGGMLRVLVACPVFAAAANIVLGLWWWWWG